MPSLRYRTLEIRWHDSKPISSCDFQPVPFKKARPANLNFGAQAYRLATAGEDNHVRVWMVHPNIAPPPPQPSDPAAPPPPAPRPARVEYLATLSRHSAAVNVVRFSPNGELIASAGDDGMVIVWAPSASPQTSTYGSDLSAADLQHEKEYWRPRTAFRCTTMQVYDLAWSPTGEFLLAGSTDNAARVFAAADGKCMHEIAEHSHYVQGVAWDPLNEYIATQSSDRSMHVYRISASKGTFEAHAIGRNTRLPAATAGTRHSRTPSMHGRERTPSVPPMHERTSSMHGERPRMLRSASVASDDSAFEGGAFPGTPASAGTPVTTSSSSAMFPPPAQAGPSSRRSSFSGSNAPSSPSGGAYGRSPSPMPALPAIRTPPGAGWGAPAHEYGERRHHDFAERPRAAQTDGARLYGDESFSNFFRRLAFSPDGALLLTPAGTFEDPSVGVGGGSAAPEGEELAARGRKARPVISTGAGLGMGTTAAAAGPTGEASSVYIYSRANFARPPVAQLPGHKKASVAVRFGPVLFELRPGVAGAGAGAEPKMGVGTATGEERERARDAEERMEVDLVGPLPAPPPAVPSVHGQIAAPAPQHASSFDVLASPALSPVDRRPPTPAASKPPTPAHAGALTPTPTPTTGSIFALPYRMLYAVVTMDTVAIYDTQQAGPVCLLTKLHYDEFTDLTWSPDGQCLMLASRDGYCTLVTFDDILPTHHTQQAALQLQQIAAQHSVPISYAPSASANAAASGSGGGSQRKRPLEPLTPAASVDGDHAAAALDTDAGSAAGTAMEEGVEHADEPPKKKRRVALTRVGDL
ncbi:WD40-repeat-containing domain protein [Mycena rosella]|uniref:WD40-repeat-containing domain protein n=1 Tax=Mycena rosella TaxID=1033263 RepID=A0AAD7DWD0_MYCRO|nr:WD40-repeat-containing domain protein [Mycena rosella]